MSCDELNVSPTPSSMGSGLLGRCRDPKPTVARLTEPEPPLRVTDSEADAASLCTLYF